jgi:hypothetical protein
MRWAAAPLVVALLGAPSARADAPKAGASEPKKVLPFIEDDYPKALAEAKARKVPLFIEAWAPW